MSTRKNAFRPVILYNKGFQHQMFIPCVVILTIQHSTEISFAYLDMRQFSQGTDTDVSAERSSCVISCVIQRYTHEKKLRKDFAAFARHYR